MVSRMLDEGPANNPAYEKLVRELGAMAYAAGGETTVSTIESFFLAMRRYPRVQACAQAELDRVVGPDRMPDLSDRAQLPYIEAILAEVYRWVPVLPLGVPHATSENDEYRGYHIPKGTIVLHNTWYVGDDSL
jgi:cytochrome P450